MYRYFVISACAICMPLTAAAEWRYSESTDPMTDAKIQIISRVAEGTDAQALRPKVLLVRCKGGTLDVIVHWNEYLAEAKRMNVRFDKLQPESQVWFPVNEKTALVSRNPKQLVAAFKTYSTLAVQVTPYSKSPTAAVFKMGGFAQKAAQLPQSCQP